TYEELNRRANQVARYLQKRGVGPGTLVGICVERSLEMMVGLLGVLKAGGGYLPLDPGYPSARLGYMLADAEVRVVLSQAELVERVRELGAWGWAAAGAQVLSIDGEWEEISDESDENVASGVGPEQVAYVIYTSGSTGQPKGVQV